MMSNCDRNNSILGMMTDSNASRNHTSIDNPDAVCRMDDCNGCIVQETEASTEASRGAVVASCVMSR